MFEHHPMKSMFLPGVERDPKPSSFADSLRMMQANGAESDQVHKTGCTRIAMNGYSRD